MQGPIGVFDSGYGGLTVLKEITDKMPENDFIYLGDNARSPYGTRSFESIYQYTLECVIHLFEMGCPLILLACNTASARALRTIQQIDLPNLFPNRRVLGIIRPTAEVVGNYSKTKMVGILGTNGTIASESYILELEKLHPDVNVFQEACPMWVPLVENNEYNNEGARYFIKKNIDDLLKKSANIDTLLLACTHYPLLMPIIRELVDPSIQIISQGKIVADSLAEYLIRHPEINIQCSKNKSLQFYTTDDTLNFDQHGTAFFGKEVHSIHLELTRPSI